MPNTNDVKRFKALRCHADGDRITATLDSLMINDLSAGEVVVRTLYAGVNYKDCLAIYGKARIIKDYPRIPGIEAVGIVVRSECKEFQSGDSVLVHGHGTGIAFDGGFSEYMRIPKSHLQKVPDGMSPLHCAMIGVPGFTVALALEQFENSGLQPADGSIAVSGATGAVGMLAIVILASAGYSVTAITRKIDQADVLRALGATEVLDAHLAISTQRPLEKARFAAAIDNVGGPVISWILRSMQSDGCVAAVGNAAGNAYDGSVLPFILRGIHLFGVVANAPWPQRQRIWMRLAQQPWSKYYEFAKHVTNINLTTLWEHAGQRLKGNASGRTLVAFNAGS